ncbi:hypothetical protein [Desulfitobacterium hafniense]|uniref:hypothetical protein n=1 Tax=Desulfitobacterium hafniense TaxID=49338 RepID=UPI003521607E
MRLIYSNSAGRKLYTRHNNDITERFPELDFALPQGTILDGEMIQADQDGKPDFESLMRRCKRSSKMIVFWPQIDRFF